MCKIDKTLHVLSNTNVLHCVSSFPAEQILSLRPPRGSHILPEVQRPDYCRKWMSWMIWPPAWTEAVAESFPPFLGSKDKHLYHRGTTICITINRKQVRYPFAYFLALDLPIPPFFSHSSFLTCQSWENGWGGGWLYHRFFSRYYNFIYMP